jgi:predicted nucleotidyltransferase
VILIYLDFEEVSFVEIEEFISKKLGIKVDLVMKSALKPYIGKIILHEVEYI